ncbi:MAG TPA: 50S ribosomal protein L3 [Candidatus Saccharimonadales bacterium]|nr:50S ribosomal protein L3 [Candidatus Saccharimonadales bacterium]
MKALIGTKIGMTQILAEDGVVVPVTLIKAGPCTVTQLKTAEKDGYDAVQLGFGDDKHLGKSVAGHVKNAKVSPKIIREFRDLKLDEEDAKVGTSFDVTVFEVGDQVDVTATSKGKGFAGTVKRHNFNTGPKSHGSMNYRKPGSIGSMYPQKIFKGKKMAGQMGGEQVTVKNLKVALVDSELGVVGLRGAVPGPRLGIVILGGKA